MQRNTRHILELWQSLGQGNLPAVDRFNSAHFPIIKPHLLVTSVADRVDDYSVREVGSAVESAYGDRLAGLKFGEIDLGMCTENIMRDYAVCVRERAAMFSRQWFKIGTAGPFERDRLLLPFENRVHGNVARIVACLFYRRLPQETSKGGISLWIEEERHVVRPIS